MSPGEILGRYRVEGLLGEGGTGVVYRAHDIRLARPVALKLLREPVHQLPVSWGELLSEAQTLSSLNHPNICTVYEVGEEEGQAYLSMEFVQGDSLAVLARRGILSAGVVADYGVQIAQALAHAHEHGVVHGDVKSANVMVTQDGLIKVLDFGLARRIDPQAISIATTSRISLQDMGPVAGTLPYLAPEILHGRPASAATDLWGAGVILHEIATGELPFTGNTAFELSVAILMDSKASIPKVPSELRAIVGRCLEKEPSRRYSRARELCEDLRAAAAGWRQAPAPPIQIRGRRWLAAGGLLIGALLTVGILSVGVEFLRHSAAVSRTTSIPERKVIAVVPFQALGDPEYARLVAEDLAESLSARLSEVASVTVIPPADLQSLPKERPIDDVAREMGATLEATGVVKCAGNNIRVLVTLGNLDNRRQLWTREFSADRKEVMLLEDRVFSSVASALRLPDRSADPFAGEARPVSSDSYDLYLYGRDAIRSYKGSADIARAIGYYDQALKRDPQFALAYAGLADASLDMYEEHKESFWAAKALHAASEAVRLSPRLAEAHLALGSGYLSTGRTKEAVTEFKQALQLQPKSDEGYRRLGSALLAMGQTHEALAAYERAIQIGPYYPDNFQMLGDAYLEIGENEKALGTYRRVTELDPGSAAGYGGMGAAYLQEGQWNECIPEFQKALQLHPDWDTYSNLGTALFYLKRYDQAALAFQKAVELNPRSAVAQGNLGDAYRWSGKKEKATAAYEEAISLTNRELEVNPRDAQAMGTLALYYAKTDHNDRSLELARQACLINPSDVGLMYSEAVVNALAGKRRAAIERLRQALANGYSPREAWNDPELNTLRDLPEFTKLTEQPQSGPN